ncbi:MAG: RyR domain-containing protein, partial [Polymorphobacter sp.]
LGDSVDYVVIDPGKAFDVRVLPVAELAATVARAPISLAYVCVDDDHRAMALAVSLQALFRREGWRTGPIFTRLVSGGALPEVPLAIDSIASAGLIAFGDTGDFAHAIGLFDSDTDAMPRMFHEAYRRTAPDHAVANLPWEELAEELRESNRRLLIHLPAKLATAGVDVASWLARADPAFAAGKDLPLPDLDSNPDLLEQLAGLEHARWMMERHLGGWQYGAVRDNARRIHPDLKPYAELDDNVRHYDRAMVKEAWTALASSAGTGFFPSGGGMLRPEPAGAQASAAPAQVPSA